MATISEISDQMQILLEEHQSIITTLDILLCHMNQIQSAAIILDMIPSYTGAGGFGFCKGTYNTILNLKTISENKILYLQNNL